MRTGADVQKIYIKYFIFGLSQYYNFKLNTDIHKNTRYHFWNHKKDSDPILQHENSKHLKNTRTNFSSY